MSALWFDGIFYVPLSTLYFLLFGPQGHPVARLLARADELLHGVPDLLRARKVLSEDCILLQQLQRRPPG